MMTAVLHDPDKSETYIEKGSSQIKLNPGYLYIIEFLKRTRSDIKPIRMFGNLHYKQQDDASRAVG